MKRFIAFVAVVTASFLAAFALPFCMVRADDFPRPMPGPDQRYIVPNPLVSNSGLWVSTTDGTLKGANVTISKETGPAFGLYDFSKRPRKNGYQFAVFLDGDKPIMQICVGDKVKHIDLDKLADIVEDYELIKKMVETRKEKK